MFGENMDGAFGSFRGKADAKFMGLNPVTCNYWGCWGQESSARHFSDLDRVRKQRFRCLWTGMKAEWQAHD